MHLIDRYKRQNIGMFTIKVLVRSFLSSAISLTKIFDLKMKYFFKTGFLIFVDIDRK